MSTPASLPARRSAVFLLVYALAQTGGMMAYLPLLTLLLPMKVAAVAGAARFGVLTATVIVGAVAASGANILFGWLSDRTLARGGGRRGWMAAGVAGTAASYALIAAATTPVAIVVAVAAFQIAVNALLAPMLAIMAEEIPDAQKGVAGGLLALANPIASALSAVLVGLALPGEGARLGIVMAAVVGGTLPLMLGHAHAVAPSPAPLPRTPMPRRDLVVASCARLLMQVAGSVLSLYLLYYFDGVAAVPGDPALPARVGRLLAIAYALPLPVALIAGRLSDRSGRRKPFLLAAAIVAAGGLATMALAERIWGGHWLAGAAGFGLYATGSTVFLTLHAAFATQLLPHPAHRGRDLGLLNLANTLPALIGPVLAWWLATPRDFTMLLLVLAAVTLAGGIATLAVRERR